jgi:hypothetical protein
MGFAAAPPRCLPRVLHSSTTAVGAVSAAHTKWVISGFLGIFVEQSLYFRVLNGFHSTTLFFLVKFDFKEFIN